MIDKVKLDLRIKHNKFDVEIADLIEAAKIDLKISGINKINESDFLIQRAIKVFCKANFGENKDSEKYMKSYNLIKEHLALCGDYR